MDNSTPRDNGIDSSAVNLLTAIGLLFIFGAILVVVLAIGGFIDRTPEELDVDVFFLSGVGLVLVAHLPWNRISFAGVEIERDRAMQERSQDYAETITELKEMIKGLMESGVGAGLESEDLLLPSDSDKQIVLDFLNKWDRWGFNLPRIQRWGGKKRGFARLREMSEEELEAVLTELVAQGDIKTWISKQGSILYQRA